MHSNYILISLQFLFLTTILTVSSQSNNEVALDGLYSNRAGNDANSLEPGKIDTCLTQRDDNKKVNSPNEQNDYLPYKSGALNLPAGGNRRMNSYNPQMHLGASPQNPNLMSNNKPQNDQPQADDQLQALVQRQAEPQTAQPQLREVVRPGDESKTKETPCKNADQVLRNGRRSLESGSNTGVTCYACSNVSSPFCIEPNDQTMVKICPDSSNCVKKVIRSEGITALVRDCGNNCDTPYSDKSLLCSICSGDLCNGAFSIKSGSFIINTIGSMVIFFAFKFM